MSGLKTALRIEAEKIAPLSDQDVADLCASFQQAVVDVVMDRLRGGVRMFRLQVGTPTALVCAGGVAANQAIRKVLHRVAFEAGTMLVAPPPALCTDNGAMIAWAGAERLALGLTDPLDVAPRPRWPLEQVTKAASTKASGAVKYSVVRLLLEPVDEPAQQAGPDFVLADGILDAVFEVGIVVDLHDHDAVVGLLEVDAVEAVADRPRGADRDIDHLARRLVEIEGAEAAFARRAVGPVFHDLPVAARHAVLAHEQRLAGEHADAPVEIGRQEFLRQQQVGFLE